MAPVEDLSPNPSPSLILPSFHSTDQPHEYKHGSPSQLGADQLGALQAASFLVSFLSLSAGFFSFYWFMRLKRNFRHNLIMLLILCDVWKATWFISFPIVGFFSGSPVDSSSAFCQASGFFLAVGTEACDIVILMIALHTALYIFRSRASECGLYRYRKPAYASLVIVPGFLASVPFAGGPGYVNVGGYCYLPARPNVYRLALSWGPRYLVFIVILTIYVSLYTYVRVLMHRYAAESDTRKPGTSMSLQSDPLSRFEEEYVMPSKPPCAHQGLASRSRFRLGAARPGARCSSVDIDRPHTSCELRRETAGDLQNRTMGKSTSWSCAGDIDVSRPHSPCRKPPFPDETKHSRGSLVDGNLQQTTPPQPAPASKRSLNSSTPGEEASSWSQPSSWVNRLLRPNTSATSNALLSSATWPQIRQSCSSRSSTCFDESESQTTTEELEPSSMAEQRNKVSRQLRILFVYPVVYMFMWIMPFVSHVLAFSDRFASPNNHQLPLLLLSLISLTAQGVVDCWLFAIREKPWNHAHKGFWEALRCNPKPGPRHVVKGPGRTRDQMMVDVRLARARRDGELADREQEMTRSLSFRTQRRRHKEWWEVGIGTGDTRWSQMPPPASPRSTDGG